MNRHQTTTLHPDSFQLDLPPLSQFVDASASLQALSAAAVWLALGVVGIGLVGGVWLGA